MSLNNAALVITGGVDFPPNEQIVLIENDGVDAINGTFNFPGEGGQIYVEGRSYLISYTGGDGNDVVLTPFQYRVFEGGTQPDGDDIFVVRRDVANPKLLHITVQSSFLSAVVDVPLNEFAGVLFRGGAGNDTLVFDGEFGYFNSGFQFVNEIIFDGGSGTNAVRLTGGAALGVVESVTYIPAGPDGGTAYFSNDFSVVFDGVSEFFSAIPTTRFEFSGTIGAPDEIAVLPGAFPEEVVISVPGQVPVTLRGQTAIALNSGGGADRFHIGTFAAAAGLATVQVNHFGSALATLTVEGSTGADTFTLAAATRTITRAGQPVITYEDPVAAIFDGGAGNDVLQITTGSALGTTFIGGPGSDALSFATSSAAVGFNADLLGSSQTLNGLGWELTLGDLVESFTGSPLTDQITIAPGTSSRSVSDPNGTGTLILDGLGSALTITGPLQNNASGFVTVGGLADPTFSYGNIGEVRTIRVPGTATPPFGTQGNTFAAALDFDTARGAASLAVGDLNADGRGDVVTVSPKTGQLSIALSTTPGLLLPAVQKLTGGKKPVSVVIADFDGVNGPDLAVTNATTGNVSIFLNDGAGGFGDATLFPVGKAPGLVRVGDIDGDNDLDLATIVARNKLAVLKGNGDGTFAAATTLATGSVKPRDFALADLDADNDLDLTVLHTGGQLATHLNDGTATFAAPVLANAGGGATALALADFNGDGRLDAAVTHNSLARFVSILLGTGTGAFLPMLKVAYPLAAKASAVVASDFDGDGRTDLAIANGAGGRVSILRGLGTGGFARALDLTLEDVPPRRLTALALGDFDGDGRTDLAALSSGSGEVSVVTRA
ncbi:MAG: VCBS repeat-containing protein [Chthoniobacteraceae bacterium]